MASEVIKIVDPDSGAGFDYDSLFDWEAGEQADLTSGDGTIAVAKCRCTGGTVDSTGFTINGWTTSGSCYIKIWTDPTETYRHAGTYPTGNKYRLARNGSAAGRLVTINEAYTKIDGLAIEYSDAFLYEAIQFGYGGNSCRISNTVFKKGSQTNGNGIRSYEGTGTHDVWNCIFYDFATAIWNYNTATLNLYNLTIHNCALGVDRDNGTVTLKNCLFASCTADASGTISDTYCATSNDNTKGLTAEGTGNRFSQTFTFDSEAGDDFHLASGDAGAKDYGVSDPGSGLFSDDIDGSTRSGSWDIGADEIVAAGPTQKSVSGSGTFSGALTRKLMAKRTVAGEL